MKTFFVKIKTTDGKKQSNFFYFKGRFESMENSSKEIFNNIKNRSKEENRKWMLIDIKRID